MFTGIVEKVGRVLDVQAAADASRILVGSGFADLEQGESIAVNGVCLTVTEFNERGDALFFVSSETLARSNLGALARDSRVNLERALSLSRRLSGHIVQGHVDGLGRLQGVTSHVESFETTFRIPRPLGRYCVEKGSITLNGVSLTINSLKDDPAGEFTEIGIMLIPHTWTHTNLSSLRAGDPVNVEVDVLAKYVERLCASAANERLVSRS